MNFFPFLTEDMLSRQFLQKAVKANAAVLLAKRHSHDVSFPVNTDKVHFHEAYDAFSGRYGIIWQPTPEKISTTQARANFKAALLAKKAEADKLYAELDEKDRALFDAFFKDALDVKKPVESGVFRPFGPRGKIITLLHEGGYIGLIKNALRAKKILPIMFLSVVFALTGFAYIVGVSILNIRAYYDGVLYPHHAHAEEHH